MKRFPLSMLVILLFILAGCGADQHTAPDDETRYSSDTSAEDCYLCGGGIEDLMPSYWGQNNVALISLNTFEIKPIEINRYDRLSGRLIEEYAGVVSFGGGGSIDGGFSANLLLEYDRGYATGSVDFLNDETLDVDKAASFLCADCLNEILPQKVSRYFGVGAIHLGTKKIRVFEENFAGFGLGDFYFDCNLMERKNSDSNQMDILIFTVRYGMRKRPERAFPFLRGCAGRSDRRERKATQACSTGRRAASPGLGGTPTGVLENPKRIFQYIARRRYYRKFLIWNSELSGVARRRKAPTPEHVEAMSDNSLERSRGNRRSSYGENMFRILAG